jgi:hypothetical protein
VPPRVVSASELAEYAFCPRAHYYRTHPDGRPAPPDSERRASAGVEYHRQTLRSDRRWSSSSAWPWVVAVLVGLVLLVLVAGSVLP